MSTGKEPPESGIKIELAPNEQWERDFPKTHGAALAGERRARGAYYAHKFPEGNFSNTPPQSVLGLLRQRALTEESIRNDVPPYFENVQVPEGLENWALEKMKLAGNFWRARAIKGIFEDRRMPTLQISAEGGFVKPERTLEETRERREVTNIMLGNFRVDGVNGKPILQTTDEGDSMMEAVALVRKRHEDWVKKHTGTLISKIPGLSKFLEIFSYSKDVLSVVRDQEVLENMILALVFAFYQRRPNEVANP